MKISSVPLVSFVALVLSLLVCIQSASAAGYVLVTDVDDTIKVSHVRDVVDRTVRFLTQPKSFTGMDFLYRQMLDSQPHAEFAVVSGAPRFLELSLKWFLKVFGFPTPDYLRTRGLFEETAQFKVEAISKLLRFNERDGAVVVMVGDDTEQDPEVYKEITQNFYIEPAVYIRRVSNRGVYAGANYFDSAADIAVIEYLAGRLEPQDVFGVYKSLLQEAELSHLFVPGEYCPDDTSPRLSSSIPQARLAPGMLRGLVAVENHLRSVCELTAAWFKLELSSSAKR